MYNPQTVNQGDAAPEQAAGQGAGRSLTLLPAVSLNVMNMIGVGPFITLPLVAAALGPGAWMGWLLGALLAVCDGLVWAELGAALPRSGGSYVYLREIYRPDEKRQRDAGRFLSFLYVWQLLFTAPLSIASGALGLVQYAGFLLPWLNTGFHLGPVDLSFASVAAAGVCLLAVLLLDRGLGAITRAAGILSVGVLLTAAAVILTGARHLHAGLLRPQLHPLAGLHGGALLPALGAAAIITTYDYWGYYNVCFLGAEVRDPGRTIPRAVLLSIAVVATLYLLMNWTVLGALPISALVARSGAAQPMAAVLMHTAFPGSLGTAAATAITLLIIWTAFASVAALLLGYSRAPYAAAREGNFFASFARTHPRHGFPDFSLIALGVIAACFCFFHLRTVVTALVAVRIVLQYALQQAGVIVLRIRQPQLNRPFRMWLYPLPALLALVGFGFLLFSRQGAGRELLLAAVIGLSGTALYAWRAGRSRAQSSES